MSAPDLTQAAAALGAVDDVLGASCRATAERSAKDGRLNLGLMDEHQVVCYDLAHLAGAVDGARRFLDYGARGETEALLAFAFAADAVAEVRARLDGRLEAFGVDAGLAAETIGGPDGAAGRAAGRDPARLADVAVRTAGGASGWGGPAHLDEEFAMLADTFKRFGEEHIRPHAEHVHRENLDVPEDVVAGVAELGCFGLTIPEAYGGYAMEGVDHTMAMVVATEQLTWASLGLGGALITRPEILSKALVGYGTEAQKTEWLPRIASGELMVAVAVTEPDFGSDVASLKVRAERTPDGAGWVLNGVKTWCTWAGRADVLMVLVRTGTVEDGHRGLSLFIVPKEAHPGHSFVETQDGGGRMEGHAIDTIGYRGMHSFEVSIENWFVGQENLVGGEAGLGRGFYMQMDAFANGRIQTAARAVGIMQAAFEEAVTYAQDRRVFGRPVGEYQLTQAKLARMAYLIQGCRQYTYAVAGLLSRGGDAGQREASMVKMFACRASEWVTREAMQIHGGFGYAEEYPVSRYYVDARVLSIFEGAEETLALRVIVRRLLEDALRSA